jgi:DNA-binding CsgD family transcriptional regulator
LLLRGSDTPEVRDAPGLILLDRKQRVRAASATAQHWLDALQERHQNDRCPYAVRALAATSARADASSGKVAAIASRGRAQTRTGNWAALHAWQITHDGEPMTALSVGPAEPAELVAIILDTYRLTARERDVTQLVLLGRSTAEIAAQLLMSAYTVQDHLKAVFDKIGVRSRRELIGHLFFGHYAPQLGRGPLATDGRLLG